LAARKWRQYLLGREFIIRTNHKPLKHLLEQRLYTEAQHSWLLKLHYKYTVVYKKGKENLATDGLSRRDEVNSIFTVVESEWIRKVRAMVN